MAKLVGLIASILGIAEAISDSFKQIKQVKGLPAAFNTVEDSLAIVEETLQLAQNVLGTHPEQTDKPHVEDKIRTFLDICKVNAESIRVIFEELAIDVEAQQESSSWQQHLKHCYKTILLRSKHFNKADRVEELIQKLLNAVHNLGNYQIFRSATQDKALFDKIDNAVDALNAILGEDPSLTEEELKEPAQSLGHTNILNNYGNGLGNMFNPSGGSNTFHTAGVMNNHHGPVTIQMPRPDAKPVDKARWIVPRPVNTLFIGRLKEIDRIRDALNNKSKRPVVVITGDGGMGKSELCLRIAELMRQEFGAVFWVDVSNQKTARTGFADIARAGFGWDDESALDYEQSLLALANSKERWLLILDNADDPDFDYSRYIPSGAQGALIITSRNPECSRYSTVRTERLETLDEDLATQLLLKAARVSPDLWQSHGKEALDVVNLLGSHTLGLIQAGAYVAAGNCQLGQYGARFLHQREKMLKWHPTQGQSRYGDVFATFEVRKLLDNGLFPDYPTSLIYKRKSGTTTASTKPGSVLSRCRWVERLLGDVYEVLGISPSHPSAEYCEIWWLAARNMQDTNHAGEAVALMEKVVEFQRATLNESHFDRLYSELQLGTAYMENKQFVKAIGLFNQIVEIQQLTSAENRIAGTLTTPAKLSLTPETLESAGALGILVLFIVITKYLRPNLPKSEIATALGFFFCFIQKAYTHFGKTWKDHSLLDSRSLTSYSVGACMDITKATIWGLLSLVCTVFVVNNHPARHSLQTIISTGHLYEFALQWVTCLLAKVVRPTVYPLVPEPVSFCPHYLSLDSVQAAVAVILMYQSTRAYMRAFTTGVEEAPAPVITEPTTHTDGKAKKV
ncbi:hypothetical protein N0V93_009861 [Gnomoniopsis smithogilvyi]|uniref:AAA+ ATPase domain-containing protein n=1 Tax=Gnomoniopsis smithogilvyi TaxID=1191159 RepID=A0A9W9CRT4_9PEZI|nr:hypothetical protein N0V93_009861 [Gnomoniopsis smithogilvyi]